MVNTVVDLTIRLKNGYLVKKENVILVYSKIAEQIVKILKETKYIKDYKIINKRSIDVSLLYEEGKPAIIEVEVISKPGRRIYSRIKDLKPTLGGLGIIILSTPKGVMTDKEAKKNKVGGEVLFKVW
jgi:small subunit ribosomal protein S8